MFLERLDVCGLLALWSQLDLEADLLPVAKRLEAFRLHFGKMGKQVFTTIVRRDETEALCIVEPLHFARLHYLIPRKLKRVIDSVLKIQKVALQASLHACGRELEKLSCSRGNHCLGLRIVIRVAMRAYCDGYVRPEDMQPVSSACVKQVSRSRPAPIGRPPSGASILGRPASDAWNLPERWRAGQAVAVAVPVAFARARALRTPEEPDRASKFVRTTNRHRPRTEPAQDA